ncbi:ribokinase [Roseomonas sp. M0104]|uniref:Ribokinase n=1 Tax=Teichococcus coralli TaxID=2545983 RepID=A0A845BEH6_9PROT|nr:PfkB family carbohydrate kinase [Pseudoroseomonas coralli]MXP64516.1 ribokinase [Pseudoroseomonas coralli]
MPQPLILSLGSVNADFQVRVPEPPATGKTLPATDFARLGGGKAANIAFLARRLGHPALLLGRTGDDELREQALKPLRAAGVDLSAVSVASGTATAVSMIAVPPDGKKSIILAGNANDAWDESSMRMVAARIAAAPEGSVLVADYEVAPELVARAIEAARRRGLRVVLDPSPAPRAVPEVLGRATALSPNASEAQDITGVAVGDPGSAAEAAARLAALGAAIVCVKLSDGGCVLRHEGRTSLVAALPVEVVDSTGAGDAFTGGLAVALLEGRPPLQAALFAAAASHLAVTAYGSQEAYAARDRTEALAARLETQVRPLGTG